MDKEELKNLFGSVYNDGDVLFREGQPGHEMYVIQEGSVEISSILNGKRAVITVLGKGEFFGEMALLDSRPRCATATVCGQARIMVLTSEAFRSRLSSDPNIALRLLKSLCEKIRKLNESIETLKAAGNLNSSQLGAAIRTLQAD